MPAKAEEIMTKDPLGLESSTDIMKAVELFTSKKFTAVPVLSSLGEIVGMLTELGLVRIIVLHQVQPEKYKKLANCLEFLEPVEEVSPKDSMLEILQAMLKSRHRRILVKSDGRRVHGIISPKDLIKHLVEGSQTAKSIQEAVGKLEPSQSASPKTKN